MNTQRTHGSQELSYPAHTARPPIGCEVLGYFAMYQSPEWQSPTRRLLERLAASGLDVSGPLRELEAKDALIRSFHEALFARMMVDARVIADSGVPWEE
jgi:hypothetical protein